MAIDFPTGPIAGQVFSDVTSGQSWTFDGTKWVGASGAALYWSRTGTVLTPATATDAVSGNLVPSNGSTSFRNILINGNVSINQRGTTYAAAAVGDYWADRWKKTAGGMTQIVEDGNYAPSTPYVLSGTGVTTTTGTSPASGNWDISTTFGDIIPSTATAIQLEVGTIPTPFEYRPIGVELALCQRYFHEIATQFATPGYVSTGSSIVLSYDYPVPMRALPTFTNQASDIRINNGGSDTQASAAPAINRVTTEHIVITAGTSTATVGRVEPKEPGTVFLQSGALFLDAEL